MVLSDLILGFVAGAAIVWLWPGAVAAQTTPGPDHALAGVAPLAVPAEGMLEEPCPAEQGSLQPARHDWAWLCRFRADNARIAQGPRPSVVFMGDSITENWGVYDPQFFSHGIVDRGISGQTSPQMLLRFYQDVVALRPRVVHIMAGTNDIAGNSGPTSPDQYRNNIMAMVALARANHIHVVLASIPPALRFAFRTGIRPAPRIAELNGWLKSYAAATGAIYADYHAVLAEPDGRIKDRYSADGVHPNGQGYAVMRPVADAAIERALRQ